MSKGVTNEDIFGGMFQNIPAYMKESSHSNKAPEKEAVEEAAAQTDVILVKRSMLHTFKNHPFRVIEDDAQMEELAESIRESGILEPLLLRPERGGYEIISGHRRNCAAGLVGLDEVPARIKELNDDEAAVYMVDSNLRRETLLASEKAWAYRIKSDALRHQGRRSDLMDQNAVPVGMNAMGEKNGDSVRTVQRYIRLTYLKEELLDLVDEGRLQIKNGYMLSFFSVEEQEIIVDYYREHHMLPDSTQMALLAEYQKKGILDEESIKKIMEKETPKKMNVTLKDDRLRQYFPQNATRDYMEQVIIELLEEWAKKRE